MASGDEHSDAAGEGPRARPAAASGSATKRTSSPHGDPLSEYRRRKLQLADLTRVLLTLANERHDHDRQAAAQQALARLAEDHFQLAVVGQFSRGKSTLMNAILGQPYLPTGALPMTSVVTTVRYGSRPAVLVRRAGSNYPIETSLDDLDRFVAQSSREREELRVVSAEVEVPAEMLRLGFSFVDTPGIGSAITANTETTERFLPEADAVIFVTSFDAPLSEAELEFLAQVRHYVEKLFLVVNKADLVDAREAETVVSYIREQLGVPADGGELRAFATSAQRALAARASNDRASLVASGVPTLEHALVHFLTSEKSRVFLRQSSARTVRLLAQQKLDLEFGLGAWTQSERQRVAQSKRFRTQQTQLATEIRALAADLLETVRAQLPAALLEHAASWPEELSAVVTSELEQHLSAPGARITRTQFDDALSSTEAALPAILASWLKQRVSDVRRLLDRIADEHIAKLLELQQSVPQLAADTFGRSPGVVDSEAATRGALEPLAAPAIAFDTHLTLSRWSPQAATARLRDDGRRRLRAAAERSAATYCEQAREVLTQAAYSWVEHVGARVEAGTREAGERVRDLLRDPCSDQHLALLAETERQLATFRDALLTWEPAVADLPDEEPLPAAPQPADLIAACVICESVGSVPFDYLAETQYQLATREDARATHAAAGGFCPLHTWLYAQIGEPIGIALSYSELAQAAARQLRVAQRDSASENELADAVSYFSPRAERCPVCVALATAERDAIAQLIDELPTGPSDETAPALCIPHLVAVLSTEPGADRGSWLAARLADALERAADDMKTFALKRQSLRRALLNDEERAAYLRTIGRVAGTRELARPWRTDDDDRLP
jgi:small GTP-binding protein